MALEFDRSIIGQIFDETSFPPVTKEEILEFAAALGEKNPLYTDETAAAKGESPGIGGMIVKLVGCELNHQISTLAIDALGELGVLYDDSPYLRASGSWQSGSMFELGLIIGGGTAQIQKNIISERGLGMPREPKAASD